MKATGNVNTNVIRLNCDIDKDLHARFKALATERGLSVSTLVRQLVADAVNDPGGGARTDLWPTSSGQEATGEPHATPPVADIDPPYWDGKVPWALRKTDWKLPRPDDMPDRPPPESPNSGGSSTTIPTGRASTDHVQDGFRDGAMRALARYGFLTSNQVARHTNLALGPRVAEKRLKRMEVRGLVEADLVAPPGEGSMECWKLSEEGWTLMSGARACPQLGDPTHGRSARRGTSPYALSYVREIGPSTASHHLLVAQVGIELAEVGYDVTTERELRIEERVDRESNGYRFGSRHDRKGYRESRVMPDGSLVRYRNKDAATELRKWRAAWTPQHRPDLRIVRLDRGVDTAEADRQLGPPDGVGDRAARARIAVEVEISRKQLSLLRRKLFWYSTLGPYSGVIYYCGNASIASAIRRIGDSMGPSLNLHVLALPDDWSRSFLRAGSELGLRHSIEAGPTERDG